MARSCARWTSATRARRRPSPSIRICASPVGTARLYRAYNNGIGGASNHRYTDDPAVLEGVITQGWAFEGESQTRVFACIPPRS
jgi:hypothetical protein